VSAGQSFVVSERTASGGHATALASETAFQQAVSLHQLGRLRDAERVYRELLARNPRSVEVHNNLGHLLGTLGQHDEAAGHYLKAIQIKPDFIEAYLNLGNTLQSLNRHEEAISQYAKALDIKPDFADALLNIGNALQTLGRNAEAVAHYRKALTSRPDYAEGHYHIAMALEKTGQIDEAVTHYERAIAIRPDYVEAYNNLGNAFRALNRYEEALVQFERACAIKPDYAEAQWNGGATLLTMGDFKGGWQRYEWRRLLGVVPSRVAAPIWLGGWDLTGKTILVYAEQGLGDTVQFARYAPLVAQRGARVVLEVQPELVSLLKCLRDVSQVCARGEPLPAIDCQAPLLSLPLAFGTTLETIPAEVPYIAPSADKVAQWRRELGPSDMPVVGLKWRSNETTGLAKSIPLELLSPLLEIRGIRFVALEKDLLQSDAQQLRERRGLTVLADRLHDFSDTAAIMSLLDVVISVDTSVAHLAGAMAKPLWLPLQFAADFRWLRGRNDSPWYPSGRLFRQARPRDWTGVVREIAEQLQNYVKAHAEGDYAAEARAHGGFLARANAP